MTDKSIRPYVWILTSGFAFSWMVTFAVLAQKGVHWQTVAIMRCAVPFIVVALWAKWDGVKLVVWDSPTLWMRSIAGSCSLLGTFYALSCMPVTDIYTISNTFPIWVALFSWPLYGRFPPGAIWLSILCSIAGVAILQGTEIQTGNYTVLVVVGVSLFTALAMLGLNRLKHLDPRAVVVHFSGTALVFAIASCFLFPWQDPPEPVGLMCLAELLGVGLAASIGQYYLTKAFTAGEPARMSVATLSQFVFVLILDVAVLQHELHWVKVWGIPLILGPTVWLMVRRVKTSALAPDLADGAAADAATLVPAVGRIGNSAHADPAICGESK